MGTKPDIIAETGLQFFGRISASISHELKNVLAIINENAGLLEDLNLMANRGQPIDPTRLKTMAATVQKQIDRADHILKNMNRFAHSSEQTRVEVDLNQTIKLFMALTERFTAMRGVELYLQLPANPTRITTAPFFLMNLLWLCLDFYMSAGGSDDNIELVVEVTADNVLISFHRLAGLAEDLLKTFPSDPETNLLAVLAAELSVEPGADEIVLRLPKKME